MENCIDFFNDFLKTELKPLMKSKGFKVSGQHFYVEVDQMIKFISIEKSSWNMKENFTFWFNASIFDKLTYNHLKEYSKITKVPHNTLFNIIQTNVSALGNVSNHYTIDFNSDTSSFKETVINDIEKILVPFIESLNDNKDLLNLYKKHPNGYIGPGIFLDLAIGFHEIEFGNNDLGLKSIKKWIKNEKKRGYWDDLVNVIEERYN